MILQELAKRYHEACALGNAGPLSPQEQRRREENALLLRFTAVIAGQRMGFTKEEVCRAIDNLEAQADTAP